MENFYFDPTVAEGLDLLEGMMGDVRDSGGRAWSTLVHCLSYVLTVYREELNETTFDPIVTVHADWGETGGVETLGSFTTYQKVEGFFSIVKVVVGEEEYSRDPSTLTASLLKNVRTFLVLSHQKFQSKPPPKFGN